MKDRRPRKLKLDLFDWFIVITAMFIVILVVLIAVSDVKPTSTLIEDIGRVSREAKESFEKGYNDTTSVK